MADRSTRHRSLSAPGRGAEVTLSLVREVLVEQPDLQVEQVAPDRLVVTRTRRPRWAEIAFFITVWLGGLGLLFLLVRQTEAADLLVVEGPRGSVVTVPPLLAGAPTDALAAALGVERASFTADVLTSPAPPVEAGGTADELDELDERTVARSSSPVAVAAPPATALLRFAEGVVTVAAGQRVVLGRAPDPAAGGQVVPGDAETVSKAHLLVSFDGEALVAEDLTSTNGTTLTRGREVQRLAPGAPTPLQPGDQVALGALPFVVELPPRVAS